MEEQYEVDETYVEENTVKKSKTSKVLSLIFDIIVIPVIVIAFVCIIVMFTAKSNNRVPTLFGKAIVTVRSNSMEDLYKVGDVLIINRVSNLDEIKVGDDIAFYAPLNTPWYEVVNGEKKSLIIFHRVMRIIYPKDSNGVKHRYFVCAGINGFSMNKNMFNEVAEGKGDYIYNELTDKCELAVTDAQKAKANYVARLLDIVNTQDPTVDEIEGSKTNTMQYVVADDNPDIEGNYDYVVGIYGGKIPSIIGSIINFSSSSTGIIVLVIVPTMLLIGYIVYTIVKEVQKAREEEIEDNNASQENVEMYKAVNATNKAQMEQEEAARQKEINDAISKATQTENIDDIIDSVVSKDEKDVQKEQKPPVRKAPPKAKGAQKIDGVQDNVAVKKVPAKKLPSKANIDDLLTKEVENSEVNTQSTKMNSSPVKNPSTNSKSIKQKPIKKIPRNRTQAWNNHIQDKKNNTDDDGAE